jgi:transposase
MNYVGIDVHKGQCVFCVVNDREETIAVGKCPTRRGDLTETLSRHVGARILLESSTDSEWVARHLEQMGFEVIVGDPNYAPMYAYASKKVKTDKRDAHALAMACSKKMYRLAQRMSDEQRRMRKLVCVRRTLVQIRARNIVEIRATLRHAGLPVNSCATEYFAAKVAQMVLPPEEKEVVAPQLTVLKQIETQLRKVDKRITQLGQKDPQVKRLTTVPGVGPVTAAMFVAVVWRVERFATAHKLEAYLGLVPGENSSGEKRQQTGITKQGHSYLRALLVQCAHTIVMHPNRETAGLLEWTQGIMQRSNRQVAVTALARKIAGILFAMWRDQKEYDGRLHPTQAVREERAAIKSAAAGAAQTAA